MPSYVLGVDGGGTKADFLLFDTDGRLIDKLKSGTCSHEQLDDGYDGTKRELNRHITALLSRNGLAAGDISQGAFGLAGCDYKSQHKRLVEILREIGFKDFVVVNDSFLGIKAGCDTGCGVCSVNGTGTVAGGIDAAGQCLQIGGAGYQFGDKAGGGHIARLAILAAYNAFYRCGPKTSLCGKLSHLFGISDKSDFVEESVLQMADGRVKTVQVLNCLFEAARESDGPAIEVLAATGEELARSAAGCVNDLNFGPVVEVVLVGSVWVKTERNIMFDTFAEAMERLTGKTCDIKKLYAPPAAGAVLWALERHHGRYPDKKIKDEIIKVTEGI